MNTISFPFKDAPTWTVPWIREEGWFDNFHRTMGSFIVEHSGMRSGQKDDVQEFHTALCKKAKEAGFTQFSMINDTLHITFDVTPELTMFIMSWRD